MFTDSVRPPHPPFEVSPSEDDIGHLATDESSSSDFGVTDLHLHLELQVLCPQSELMDALGIPSRFLRGTHAYLRC